MEGPTDQLSLTFAALADPTRRAILVRLSQGEASVTELAAPFESSAHFRFFQFDRDTSDVTATASDVRGLELVLNAESRYAASGESAKERSPFRTAVFFNNRVN